MGLFNTYKTKQKSTVTGNIKRFARVAVQQPVYPAAAVDVLPPVLPEPQLPAERASAPRSLSKDRAPSVAQTEAVRCSAEDRALRDEKCHFVWTVEDYRRSHPKITRIGTIPAALAEAVEWVAANRASDFPRLLTAGKKGASALTVPNYRNWTEGRPSQGKFGLIDPATGKIDYSRRDFLLPGYGKKLEIPAGDPAFWRALEIGLFQSGENKISVLYRTLQLKWQLKYPGIEIPTLQQVYYWLKTRYPARMKELMRKGDNHFDQHRRVSVMRDPNTIRPNEAWVSDTQDCDFFIRVPDGKDDWDVTRPKICVMMDIKAQYVVSVQFVSGAVSNEIIRNALALGVREYGRPKALLTDNGTDYCKQGFTAPVVFTPDVNGKERYEHSILKELDIEHHIARKYNGRTKYVERFFNIMADYYRMARGYVGNKPENRPAEAAVWEKKARKDAMANAAYLWDEAEAAKFIGAMIELYHKQPSPKSKYLRGLSPEQAFAPELRYTRPELSHEEYLAAFRMPESKAYIVDPRGPGVSYRNKYYTAVHDQRDRLWNYEKKPVMIKYDQISEDHCFVYDLDGTFLCECRVPEMLPYFDADKDTLGEHLRRAAADVKYFKTLVRDRTGGWHKLDPATVYQLPREMLMGPARLKLVDSRYSVKGQTHNPRIYALQDETPAGAPPEESAKPRNAQSVPPPAKPIDKDLHKQIINLLTDDEDVQEEPNINIDINITDKKESSNDHDQIYIPADF